MKQLMRVWKLYKITDNPRLDFNKMRKFYNKPLLTQIFLLTKFPVPVPAMTPVKSVRGVGAGVRLPGRKLESVKCHLCRVPVKCSQIQSHLGPRLNFNSSEILKNIDKYPQNFNTIHQIKTVSYLLSSSLPISLYLVYPDKSLVSPRPKPSLVH